MNRKFEQIKDPPISKVFKEVIVQTEVDQFEKSTQKEIKTLEIGINKKVSEKSVGIQLIEIEKSEFNFSENEINSQISMGLVPKIGHSMILNNSFLPKIQKKITKKFVQKEQSENTLNLIVTDSSVELSKSENEDPENDKLTKFQKSNPRKAFLHKNAKTLFKKADFINLEINSIILKLESEKELFYVSSSRLFSTSNHLLKTFLIFGDFRDFLTLGFHFFFLKTGKMDYSVALLRNFYGFFMQKELKSGDKVELTSLLLPYQLLNPLGMIKQFLREFFLALKDSSL